jgi:hypothetical protein
LRQPGQQLHHPWQISQVIALDLDQAQAGLGMLGEQGTHQRRFTGAASAPEQRVVGRQAADELTGIARQLFALGIHA